MIVGSVIGNCSCATCGTLNVFNDITLQSDDHHQLLKWATIPPGWMQLSEQNSENNGALVCSYDCAVAFSRKSYFLMDPLSHIDHLKFILSSHSDYDEPRHSLYNFMLKALNDTSPAKLNDKNLSWMYHRANDISRGERIYEHSMPTLRNALEAYGFKVPPKPRKPPKERVNAAKE